MREVTDPGPGHCHDASTLLSAERDRHLPRRLLAGTADAAPRVNRFRADRPAVPGGLHGSMGRGKQAIVGDDDAAWLYPAFAEIFRLMKPDTFCVSFYGWPHAELFVAAWKDIGFRLVSHLAFVKNVWGLGRFTRGQHETAYLLAKGRPPRRRTASATSSTGSGRPPHSTRIRSRWRPSTRSSTPTRAGGDGARPFHGERQHAPGREGLRPRGRRDRDRRTLGLVCRRAYGSGSSLCQGSGGDHAAAQSLFSEEEEQQGMEATS